MGEAILIRAKELLDEGLDCVADGRLEEARRKFKASSFRHQTADAYTYWGWMEHHLGQTEFAIKLCLRAIEIDPSFGNPYNDIGSYLISLGQVDEAVPWLKKAISAPSYESKHYPHMNLGRVYIAKAQPDRALKEFEKALEFAPDDGQLLEMIKELRQSLPHSKNRHLDPN